MKKQKKNSKGLDIGLIILVILVLAALVFSFLKGGWQLTFLSLTKAGGLFEKIWFRLLLGFLLGGFIQVLIPRSLVAKWLGAESGLKGILIGSYVSMFSTGGPFVWLPIVASIYRSGADIGPVLSLVTARGILSIQMLVIWQIPFFGVELSLSRYIPCLFIPPIVGLLGRAIFRVFGWSSLSPDAIKDSYNESDQKGTLEGKRRD